jgi:signal transduction histidine kinase
MSTSQAIIPAAADSETSAWVRLRAAGLAFARAAWVAIVLPTVVLYALGLVVGFGQLRTVCAGDVCRSVQLSPQQAALNQRLGLSPDFYGTYTTFVFAAFGLVFFAVAALIFWRRSHDWMALLLSLFLVLNGAGAMPVIESVGVIQPQLGRMGSLMFLLAVGLWPAIFGLLPDGRFVPSWMRWLALAWLVRMAVVAATFTPSNGGGAILSGPPSPITVSVFAASIGAQVYRYRRVSTLLQRQQTKWVVFGFGASLVLLLVMILAHALTSSLAGPGPSSLVYERYIEPLLAGTDNLFIPVTLAIAILRYRLWDVDVVINRALVYSALTAVIVGLYVLVVGALGVLFQTRGSLLLAVLATGLAAVLFQPLRQRLQRAVNRLMYGDREDPYAVLARLGQRLEEALQPDAVLPTVAATVREVLRLPYVAVYLQHGPESFERVAESAAPNVRFDNGKWQVPGMGSHGLCVPLVYQGETVGHLVLGPHAPGEAFNPAERKLLGDLARQAGVAAHAVCLTADLQRSREQLVTAREEERRRLRRDLHDGLGSVLAAVNLQSGALGSFYRQDPEAGDAAVAELRGQLRSAVADIRRLVYDLRPPALDELGLAGAIRSLASRSEAAAPAEGAGNAEQPQLQVQVSAPESLGALPAAVEVAAYRIVQETLANVVKHARAQNCHVRVMLHGDLGLEITDDGVGLPGRRTSGVGLRSMTERAAELGGTCVVEPITGGGTRVAVRLPLPSKA